VKLKQNRSPDIDVKAILKEIRDEALRVLKKDFLGEQKQFEEYSKKLCTQFKNDSKSVIADVKHRMDVALTEVINKQIADKLESKIRRCDPSISSFEILLELS
jgi:tetrahydrodipicolinate N-succinyltransferase